MPRRMEYLPDMTTTPEGQRVLLGAARPVQDFARSYRDPTKGEPIDFGPTPWWVPDGLHLAPIWSAANPPHLVEPRERLSKAIRDYYDKAADERARHRGR